MRVRQQREDEDEDKELDMSMAAGCVWDVAFLSNNDLVTACSDYVARIWSIDESRQAGKDIQESYRAALAPKQSGGCLRQSLPPMPAATAVACPP
jgi:hypothetical protein